MSDKPEVTYTLASQHQWNVFTGEPEAGGELVIGIEVEIEGVVTNFVMTPLMAALIAKALTDAVAGARRGVRR